MLCVLDTNVVSELINAHPDPAVLAWFDRAEAFEFASTTISFGESWRGIERLPSGLRKRRLLAGLHDMLAQDMAGRLLPFDAAAMKTFVDISSRRQQMGRPMSFQDACIAATCLAHGAEIATRDTSGFDGVGLVVHNPWA